MNIYYFKNQINVENGCLTSQCSLWSSDSCERHTHPFIPPSISVAVRHCKVEGREQKESREVGATSCCATVFLSDPAHATTQRQGSVSASVKCTGGTGSPLRM